MSPHGLPPTVANLSFTFVSPNSSPDMTILKPPKVTPLVGDTSEITGAARGNISHINRLDLPIIVIH